MTRKMLCRRAVAGLAKPVQNDLAALNAEEDAKVLAENRRLRGEVRRLRRALRGTVSVLAEIEHLAPTQVPFLVTQIKAALAPRRRKP